MTIFLSGGSKSGKSALAQRLAARLARGGPLYYVAAMIPADDEDRARIARHIEDRADLGFQTIECGRDLPSCLETADAAGTFLLDSVTALLMNELFPDPAESSMDLSAPDRCCADLSVFIRSVKNAVIVSDFIYSDAARYDDTTEAFRRGLARIDRLLASRCDAVAEVSAGIPYLYKGELPL